jgi:hypothetical protein
VKDSRKICEGIELKPEKKCGHLATLGHGLYFHPEKFKIDSESDLGQALTQIVDTLLEDFPGDKPPYGMARLLAMRTAFKLIRAASYEAFVFSGEELPALLADTNYLKLTGSIRADIQTLHILSKEAGGGDKAPSLEEYLAAIKSGQLVVGEASSDPASVAKPLPKEQESQD